MNLNELANAAQSLPIEEQKALIKTLFQQLPKPQSLAGSVTHIGDLSAASQATQAMIQAALTASAQTLNDNKEP